MKTHLKYAIAGLALLASLSLGNTVRAENSTPQTTAQQSVSVQPPVIGPIAWQRVGAPISMEG
jgi:hypothetical protein